MQGQLLTREGLTLTEDPEVFQLLGVYVAATGHLHARVEPASGPMTVALADNETTVHPAAYRSAPVAMHTCNGKAFRVPKERTICYIALWCYSVCTAFYVCAESWAYHGTQAGSAPEGSHVDDAWRAAAAVLLHAQGPHRLLDKGKHWLVSMAHGDTQNDHMSFAPHIRPLLVSEHGFISCKAVYHCWAGDVQMDRECPLVLDMHVAPVKSDLQPASPKERRKQPASSPEGSQKTGDSPPPYTPVIHSVPADWTSTCLKAGQSMSCSALVLGCHPVTGLHATPR